MSKPLNRRAAANAFARGVDRIRTACALSFMGDVAYSYDEPIAVRVGSVLYVTTAKFSMTTSHHRGQVAGAWAVEHQIVEYTADRSIGCNPSTGAAIHNVEHALIRQMARERFLPCGPWGRKYEEAA